MVDKASVIREAQKYLAKGQIDKAIVEWEKLLKELPDGTIHNTIGDLYLKKGDKQLAIEAFHKASKIFREEGFSLKALALYKKILNINPSDGDSLFALGELNEEKNIVMDAIKYYLAAADVFSKENKKPKLLSAYDKILNLAPTNIPLRVKISELFSKEGFVTEAAKEYVEIGGIYEGQNDLEGAKKYFAKALEIQPGSRDALLGISKIAERTKDFDGAVKHIKTLIDKAGEDTALLLRIGHLLIAKGSFDDAIDYISKAVQAEPSNLDAKRLLGDAYIRLGDMPKAWQEYNTVLDEMIFKENHTEAINILNMFKEIDPIESRRKLISLHRQIGDNESAVMEFISLAEIFEGSGMQVEALKCYQEAYSMKPESTELKIKISELEKELGIEAAASEKSLEEVITEADIFLRYGLYEEAKTLLEGLKVNMPENMDVHLKLKSLYMDTSDKELAVTECLILAELYSRAGQEDKRQGMLTEAFEINPEDPRLAERALPVKAEAAPVGEGPAPSLDDYAEDLSEADFYAKQGLMQEAAEIYKRLLGIFPGDGDIRGRLAAIESVGEEAAPAKEEEETISLEEFVVPEIEPEPQAVKEPELDSDVLEIFEEFKKGLAKDLEAEDYETHYNLGIAYKEMGLIDDAINEFQTAKSDPKFFIQSTSILGMCYMQKGLFHLAVDAFSSTLMKMEGKDEGYRSLSYDLAEAYEKNGDLKEAFQLYTDIYGWNSKFRDVAEKINQLKGVHIKAEVHEDLAGAFQQTPDEKTAVPSVKVKEKKKSRVSYI